MMSTPLANKLFSVDAAGIGGRNMPLPGEVSWCRVHWEKSRGRPAAEAIVVGGNELPRRWQRSHKPMKG
ncbi:hypothetical protein [Cesiribacter sp. SM1]|uniref:hypothetical protein n=1 Tax=Cesiribacter sp. SM1 TaxID=2861196 RepID=UPI001CD5D590|nr:hypothetical protein [Cesiribacter sp. SM1]